MGIQKKLITFQTMDACRSLICKGYLECGEKHIDREKSGYVYEWVLEKMQESVPNLYNAPWPVWCWARFKNGVCPPRACLKNAFLGMCVTLCGMQAPIWEA